MDNFAFGVGYVIGMTVMLGFLLTLYMLPFIVALFRHHHRKWWICLLNFVSGWTVVGWVGALVW